MSIASNVSTQKWMHWNIRKKQGFFEKPWTSVADGHHWIGMLRVILWENKAFYSNVDETFCEHLLANTTGFTHIVYVVKWNHLKLEVVIQFQKYETFIKMYHHSMIAIKLLCLKYYSLRCCKNFMCPFSSNMSAPCLASNISYWHVWNDILLIRPIFISYLLFESIENTTADGL